MKYKISEGKQIYITLINPKTNEKEEYILGDNDQVDMKIEDNTLYVNTGDNWYATINNIQHAIEHKQIEEIK